MSTPRYRPALSAAIILLIMAGRTMADDFFNLVAVGSGGTTVANTGGNIIHLTDNLISLNSSFILLAGQNINASMSWGGVPNAIRFTENAAQTVATLSFPTTGFTTTFVGTSAARFAISGPRFHPGGRRAGLCPILENDGPVVARGDAGWKSAVFNGPDSDRCFQSVRHPKSATH